MIEFRAGSFFDSLRWVVDRPLRTGSDLNFVFLCTIEFPTDEEAHNDDLQKAVYAFADAVLDMIVARGVGVWGKPDFTFMWQDDPVPAWVQQIGLPYGRLVGWKRGRHKVAFALWEKEDREIPTNVCGGVVRCRTGSR
jgi:hypothetical protein